MFDTFDKIMPVNSSGKEVCGYLNALNEEFYVNLKVEADFPPKNLYLRGCKKLETILKPVLDTLIQHLLRSNSIKDMLSEIQNTVEKQIRSRGPNNLTALHIQYNLLLEQLQICGWDRVQYISPDFHSLHLKAVDDFNREHILKLWIPEKFPNEEPKYECDLPSEFNYKWLPDDTLVNLFNAFQECLTRYCEFWNYMDELDSKTWVLDPENPTRKDCKRRIALTSGVSLLLIVNPSMPSCVPTCYYLGPERVTEPIRQKLSRNIHLWSFAWNVAYVILINLVKLFLKLFVMIQIAISHFIMPVCMNILECYLMSEPALTNYLVNALIAAVLFPVQFHNRIKFIKHPIEILKNDTL